MFSNRDNNIPIIFVPGLFGSMSNEIIPGTGGWSFGKAKLVYDPFIEILQKMGYELNKDLFISFYDWRKSCVYSAKIYLLETIKKAKQRTKSEKVNLICHSMGGLVARVYVQSDYYDYDVENMILIATPNAGSPPNYSYWEGGEIPGSQGLGFNFARTYMDAYMWLLGEFYKNDKIEVIHTYFEGLGDLLPCKQYGDYLFYKEMEGAMALKPYNNMICKNEFLDKLNDNMYIIDKRNVGVILIAGIGEKTINLLQVVPSDSQIMWIDGKVVGFTESTDGDSNVMVNSVFCIDGKKYILLGSHIEILYKCEYILKKVLFY